MGRSGETRIFFKLFKPWNSVVGTLWDAVGITATDAGKSDRRR